LSLTFALVVFAWSEPAAIRLRADTPAQVAKVADNWDAAYLSGTQSGWFRTKTEERKSEKTRVFATTLTMNLQLKRYGSIVNTKMETMTEEDEQGKVLNVTLIQHLDQGEALTRARVEGNKLIIRPPGNDQDRQVPYDPEAIGPRKAEGLLREKKAKTGDTIRYKTFEPSLLMVTGIEARVKGEEEIDVFVPDKADSTRANREKRKLLRVDVVPDPINLMGTPLQLPTQTIWVDDKYESLHSRTEMPGMGVLHLFRTTKDIASKPGAAPELLPDLGTGSAIVLAKRVPDITSAKKIRWKMTIPDEANPAAAFTQDDRQTVGDVDKGSFVLTVKSGRDAQGNDKPNPEVGGEFKDACYYLDSDDATVRALARLAVGNETDPWKKAVKIEQFVNRKMKVSSDVGFATASQVARSLTGDCRQHAMLAAAMCRAEGIPSRTALGLVYVDQSQAAILGFHMWMEVNIDGQWRGLDPIFGLKGLTPGHLKICDHSWKNTQTLAPLLPVLRVMGKLQAEILEVEG